MSLTPEEIYENFKSATGTGSQQEGHAVIAGLSTNVPDRAYDIQRIIDGTQQAWTGEAADQAVTGLAPLAGDLLNAGDTANTGQSPIASTIAAFHTAASKVVPMPPKPQIQNPLAALAQGKNPFTMLAQTTAYNKAANTNVTVMQEYESVINGHVSSLPSVDTTAPTTASPTSLPTPVNVRIPTAPADTPSSSGTGTTGSAGVKHAPSTSGGSGYAPAASAAAPAAAPAGSSPAPQVPGAASGSTSTSGYAGTTTPATSGGTTGGLTNTPISAGQTGGFSTTPEPDPSFSAGNISGILSGEKPSLPGGGSLGGGSGSGTTGQPKSGGGRSGAGSMATEEKAMAKPGAIAAEKGGTGMAGGPIGGGRGGTGKDDEEHESKYQITGDKEWFLNQTLVAPQVIGESQAAYEARIARDSGQDR